MKPSQLLQKRQAERGINLDPAQALILDKLDELYARLAVRPSRWRLPGRRPEPVRGLYIHGEVGRGKTMLMDLFFDSIEDLPKRREHFHAFMQNVHRQRTVLRGEDVIPAIADAIAASARLLCLDEMQIVDIADAMIIGRLFVALTQRGVTLVTTSNLPPEGLYKDGLNRSLFLPFITQLRERLDVVCLDGTQDYRLGRIAARDTYISPSDDARLMSLWDELTDGAAGEAMDLPVLGRTLHVPHAAHGCARFTFGEICEAPLGPPDYLALSAAFKTIFIAGIPLMKDIDRNVVKRFVLMIDTFYDAKTRLAVTAAAAPEKLYPRGHHGLEFKRTVSRLKDMQSTAWWGA